jgi:predicted dehydrogenase
MGDFMPDSSPLRFGIIGCGSASLPVCEAIHASPLAELTALYDTNYVLADDISQRFHVTRMESLEALLSNQEVDAVYVAVPHDLLAPLTHQVLEAHKHVLTEKPLAISLEQIDQLSTLAVQHHRILGVFYEMRYAPAHAAAREFVQAGAIGEIFAVQIQTLIDKPLAYWQSGYHGRSTNPWRAFKAQPGGGVILMNTSHLLDALFYITGLAVTAVSAVTGTRVANVEVEDTASAILQFNNGAVGSLIAGAHISGSQNEECCLLFGTEGQIRIPDPYGSDPMRIFLKKTAGEFTAGEWHSLCFESVPVYRRAIEDFARAVQADQCAPIGAKAARQVLSVVLGIYRSAAEKRWISID